MQVATRKQTVRLVQQGDEKLCIAAAMAASAINEILDGWGNMADWEIRNQTQHLRSLLEMIEGKEA